MDWNQLLPEQEWVVYREVIGQAREAQIPFALGGGLAFSVYSGRVRNTKDMDLFILPRDRDAIKAVLDELKFQDYFEKLPYDREWIYRGHKGDLIVDTIWRMANHLVDVDEEWLTRGKEIKIGETLLRLIPLEEMIWAKMYVMQRERCDWPDLLSVLNRHASDLDWERLIRRVGDDWSLLGGLVSVFRWMKPSAVDRLPDWIWPRLGLGTGPVPGGGTRRRAALLDSRDWFGPKKIGE